MKKSEMSKIIIKLMTVYPSFKFGANVITGEDMDLTEVINIWHEMIGDMEYGKAEIAVNACINKCKFVPSIAEIREEYDSLVKAEKTEYYAVKNEFERCRNYYPGSGSIDNGWPEFQERLKKAKEGMQIEAARYLANKVIGYVHECEKNGSDPIDLAECIRTIEV